MKHKILVTGANGLIGQKIIQRLLKTDDVEVVATSQSENKTGLNITFHILDLLNFQAVQQLVIKEKPTAIIHTAAITLVDTCENNRQQAELLNTAATVFLHNIAEQRDIFFLYLSTDFVFDGIAGPYRETDICNPINFYGLTKWNAEKAVQAGKSRWAIARTVLVYGVLPHLSRSNIMLWVKKNLEEGKAIRVVDDQIRTPTLAEDIAEGCCQIVLLEKTGIFHISGRDLMTPYQIALLTADFYSLNNELISPTNASEFVENGKRPLKTGFIIDKAIRELRYKPHSFEQGLEIFDKQLKNK